MYKRQIQSAAHEDANIIFGAVMDEKMKDDVKITVIATGFREARAARHHPVEVRTSFASAHDQAMDFPDSFGPRDPEPPKHIMAGEDTSRIGAADARNHVTNDDQVVDDAGYVEEIPAPVEHAAEVISLDSVSRDIVRNGVLTNMGGNFEQDDLDVPAFLRKRNEVM